MQYLESDDDKSLFINSLVECISNVLFNKQNTFRARYFNYKQKNNLAFVFAATSSSVVVYTLLFHIFSFAVFFT